VAGTGLGSDSLANDGTYTNVMAEQSDWISPETRGTAASTGSLSPSPRVMEAGSTPQRRVANAAHLGVRVGDPAQTLRQRQVVHRGVALGEGEHLIVLQTVDRARRGSSDDRIHQPDLALTPPQSRQGQRIRGTGFGADADRLRPEMIDDRGADPVVAGEVVAEAGHQDGGTTHGASSRITCTEHEIQGS
jgi:hypothetical protein